MPYGDRELLEKVEILAGDRPRARDQAAVRVEDLAELLQLASIKTATVSAAPTAADFNSLLADLKEIHNRLSVVANLLQQRLRL